MTPLQAAGRKLYALVSQAVDEGAPLASLVRLLEGEADRLQREIDRPERERRAQTRAHALQSAQEARQ